MLFYAILPLCAAVVLSSTAAFFSITGLMALFHAAAIPVAIMGCALEFGKIVAASWIHKNWNNSKVKLAMRSYMLIAIFILMVLTSTGIFGFLSAGHLDSFGEVKDTSIKIERINQQIQLEQNTIERAETQLKLLDKSLDVYFNNDKASQGLKARQKQASERQLIQDTVKKSDEKINQLQNDLLPLKTDEAAINQKIGPIKYVAKLLFEDYDNNIDTAIRIVIIMIILVFDPLAILLIIASSISFSDYYESRLPKNTTKAKLTQKYRLRFNKLPNNSVSKLDTDIVSDTASNTMSDTVSNTEPPTKFAIIQSPPIYSSFKDE